MNEFKRNSFITDRLEKALKLEEALSELMPTSYDKERIARVIMTFHAIGLANLMRDRIDDMRKDLTEELQMIQKRLIEK